MYEYKTSDTCSTKIHFDIRDGKIYSLAFDDGCDGNLKAISVLAEGMDAEELVRKLRGLCCGRRKTSCADQLARAVEQRLGVCCASCVKPPKIADEAIFYPANSKSTPDDPDFCVTDDAKIHKCNRLL
jgi:uncharacterized protein (TIGR03905 family)